MREVALKIKIKQLAGCDTEWRMTQQCKKQQSMRQLDMSCWV